MMTRMMRIVVVLMKSLLFIRGTAGLPLACPRNAGCLELAPFMNMAGFLRRRHVKKG
jgi:hypothetical protein